MRAAAAIHTNNKANISYLAGILPEAAGKIRQIYNSLTLTGRDASPVHLEPPYRCLLAVGRFCRTKGFDVLIDACAILARRNFPFQLTLVGAGLPWPTALIRRRIRIHGLRARVFLPGFVSHDRMSELYAAADIFVMPSVVHASGDRDGIPNVIMEALAHRIPVVATDVSGIPEVVIEDGVTGRLVAQRDPEAVAAAVLGLPAADREAALAMAEAGKTRGRLIRSGRQHASHPRLFRIHPDPEAQLAMCGIAGFIWPHGATAPGGRTSGAVVRHDRGLAHRGPDGEGLVIDGPAGLAIAACPSSIWPPAPSPWKTPKGGRTLTAKFTTTAN